VSFLIASIVVDRQQQQHSRVLRIWFGLVAIFCASTAVCVVWVEADERVLIEEAKKNVELAELKRSSA
jgi:hypothetical protein